MNYLKSMFVGDTPDSGSKLPLNKSEDRLRKCIAEIKRETREERERRLKKISEIIAANCDFQQLMLSSGIEPEVLCTGKLMDEDEPWESSTTSTMFIPSNIPGLPLLLSEFDEESTEDSTTVDTKDLKTLLESDEQLYETVKAFAREHHEEVRFFIQDHGDSTSGCQVRTDKASVVTIDHQDQNDRAQSEVDKGAGDFFPLTAYITEALDIDEEPGKQEVVKQSSILQLASTLKRLVSEENIPRDVLEDLLVEQYSECVKMHPNLAQEDIHEEVKESVLKLLTGDQDQDHQTASPCLWDSISPSPMPTTTSDVSVKNPCHIFFIAVHMIAGVLKSDHEEAKEELYHKSGVQRMESSDEVPERAASQVTIDDPGMVSLGEPVEYKLDTSSSSGKGAADSPNSGQHSSSDQSLDIGAMSSSEDEADVLDYFATPTPAAASAAKVPERTEPFSVNPKDSVSDKDKSSSLRTASSTTVGSLVMKPVVLDEPELEKVHQMVEHKLEELVEKVCLLEEDKSDAEEPILDAPKKEPPACSSSSKLPRISAATKSVDTILNRNKGKVGNPGLSKSIAHLAKPANASSPRTPLAKQPTISRTVGKVTTKPSGLPKAGKTLPVSSQRPSLGGLKRTPATSPVKPKAVVASTRPVGGETGVKPRMQLKRPPMISTMGTRTTMAPKKPISTEPKSLIPRLNTPSPKPVPWEDWNKWGKFLPFHGPLVGKPVGEVTVNAVRASVGEKGGVPAEEEEAALVAAATPRLGGVSSPSPPPDWSLLACVRRCRVIMSRCLHVEGLTVIVKHLLQTCPQARQVYGFTPVCSRMCRVNMSDRVNDLLQMSHKYALPLPVLPPALVVEAAGEDAPLSDNTRSPPPSLSLLSLSLLIKGVET
ncbi:unnamed protein product [Notodromas monacha]|uniref:Uncharacterized protein n=1 Tax=Notodromas monacha TaxID=399045 RepID=A0A7R9BE76_9CRUS|nr:unnamed protein product [Notodromas monacha]CAG0912512.1 unnamed protein product [Notodromas monacha]